VLTEWGGDASASREWNQQRFGYLRPEKARLRIDLGGGRSREIELEQTLATDLLGRRLARR
jgi:hypothetical protein